MPHTSVATKAPTRTIPVVDSSGRPIRCGQRVRIPKHTRIYGSKEGLANPKGDINYTWSAYTVTVRDSIDGLSPDESSGDLGREPSVVWTGTAGYRHETPAHRVTIID
jgi:hypothetical protein